MKTTRTPWKASGREVVTDAPGQLVPYIVAQCGVYALTNTDREGVPEANAEFIARAANCHADLLAALEAAEWTMRSHIMPEHFDGHAAKALEQVRAALAKAKEG
jgi:hypothetical protein